MIWKLCAVKKMKGLAIVKKMWISLLLTALFLGGLPVSTAYAAGTVQVSLPDHAITLNGQTISSEYSRYPFLVYKDITYFPMTYYDCKLLGLSTVWTKETGLSIEQSGASLSEYIREVQTVSNTKTQRAQIAEGPIAVNGKVIDNGKEPYPILSFRNITYFPLTWRFAVEEFGWDYEYDNATGLTVSSPGVSFTSEEEWDGAVSEYGGLMGTGNMELPCMFGVFALEDQLDVDISLYNATAENILVLKDDFQWEYQIYRTIGKKDELVYRKAIPFFSGELPASHFASISISDHYWDKMPPDGEYKYVLIHPAEYRYQISGKEQIWTAPTEGDGYRVTFSETIMKK